MNDLRAILQSLVEALVKFLGELNFEAEPQIQQTKAALRANSAKETKGASKAKGLYTDKGAGVATGVKKDWPSWAPEPLTAAKYVTANHFMSVKDWPARYFKPEELGRKNTRGTVIVARALLQKLDALRAEFGKPLSINSGYRDPAYNKKVGGAIKSRHQLGWAVDISTRGMNQADRRKLLKSAKKVGFTGIGYYQTFLHLDIGTKREWNADQKGLFA